MFKMFRTLFGFIGIIIFILALMNKQGQGNLDFHSIMWIATAVVSFLSMLIKKLMKFVAVLIIILCLYTAIF